MQTEEEVFRYDDRHFDTTKYYEYAYQTRQVGKYPNTRYFTTKPLRYAGRYLRFETWGWGDGGGCAAIFAGENGEEIRIEYDYEGTICFREICQ